MNNSDAIHNLNKELAEALGVPPNAMRAVLTIQGGRLPLLEIEMAPQRETVQVRMAGRGTVNASAVKSLHFTVQLVAASK